MKRRALSSNNAPRQLDLTWLAVGWLLADRIGLPQWAWGVFWVGAAVVATVIVWDFCTAEDVELPKINHKGE